MLKDDGSGKLDEILKEGESPRSRVGDLKSSCPSHVGNFHLTPASSDLHLGKEDHIFRTRGKEITSPDLFPLPILRNEFQGLRHKVSNDLAAWQCGTHGNLANNPLL